MFSVTGWNVSAPLEKQVVPAGKSKDAQKRAQADANDEPRPILEKRKREASKSGIETRSRGQEERSSGRHGIRTKEICSRDAEKSIEEGGKGRDSKPREEREQRRTVVVEGGDRKKRQTVSAAVPRTRPESGSVLASAASRAQDDVTYREETVAANSEASTKRKRKRKKSKNDAPEAQPEHGDEPAPPSTTSAASTTAPLPTPTDLTPLQSAMRQKLVSSRFRYLNQTLYTTPSSAAAELFRNNPTFFTDYHEGFARQVESWPENPVDGFARLIMVRGSVGSKGYTSGKVKGAENRAMVKEAQESVKSGAMGVLEPLPRDIRSHVCTIIDLGCGSGSFARQLQPFMSPLGLQVYSFDLAAPNELVTIADIRNLPLVDSSVDVAVFSLALMGTNWIDFIEEAWRVLRWKGECWVADVNSRFACISKLRGQVEHSVGTKVKRKNSKVSKLGQDAEDDGLGEEVFVEEGVARKGTNTDVSAFVEVLKRRGFALAGEPDVSNKMFARMRFVKALTPSRGKCKPKERERIHAYGGQPRLKFLNKGGLEDDDTSVEDEARVLKPCVYKTR